MTIENLEKDFPGIYEKCKKDARKEVENSKTVYKLAKKNAKNQIRALLESIIAEYNKRYDKNYKIKFE